MIPEDEHSLHDVKEEHDWVDFEVVSNRIVLVLISRKAVSLLTDVHKIEQKIHDNTTILLFFCPNIMFVPSSMHS